MATVKVYTVPSCAFCFALKEFLKEKNIEFEEIDISKDKEAAKKIVEKTGKMETPVVEIEGEFVVGFDKEKILNLLKEKGQN